MNKTLMKAILSMDSYNRGYNSALLFGSDSTNSEAINGVTQVGNYTVISSKNDTPAQDIGFYAIAYQNTNTSGPGAGETVIAYRGTDAKIALGALDVMNAYGVGDGYAETPQSQMAFDFYQCVNLTVNSNLNPYAGSIELTGHSSGGGLAGLVAGAYGKDATLFDNMAFQTTLNGGLAASMHVRT